ncbi:MAG: alpha-L-glutamate ligase-like protein, partial [Betaproteobacteria bacterium]|nr:alpha-L-glutamate ligase-like protein [Betaproteobacteria bacterium]
MKGLIAVARALRANGVMGINERNAEFNLIHNERSRFPLVDDKL